MSVKTEHPFAIRVHLHEIGYKKVPSHRLHFWAECGIMTLCHGNPKAVTK